MTALPSSLALTNVADGALIIASDHRNNYSSVQTAVNALIAALASGTAGQVLVSGGAAAVSFAQSPVLSYRKTTAKTVNTTVAATDLLNGEITVAAGVMGTTGVLRLTAWGDWLQNSGGAAAPPRFQFILGGTTLLDTSTIATVTASATRTGWRLTGEIVNLGAANSQMSNLQLTLNAIGGFATFGAIAFATGTGVYQSALETAGASHMAFAEGLNAATAVDTSAAKALELKVINGSASASYETKLLGAIVEII